MSKKTISGFSKLSKKGKIQWIVENFFKDPEAVMREFISYWHSNEEQQKILDGFSENTISNFPMPYGVAPNFLIDGQTYAVPMVIEESSVVAAASSASKFWIDKGGFKTTILGTVKEGQVHFIWNGPKQKLIDVFHDLKDYLVASCDQITSNMVKRGGGIKDIQLKDFTAEQSGYYQLSFQLETCDSMGANFINSVLEESAQSLQSFLINNDRFDNDEKDCKIIMSILSNYTPNCKVLAEVSCSIQELGEFPNNMSAEEFAEKFYTAVKIAKLDPYRATTHNKGIFNGIDAVVLATGNDFRAVEACGHAYASRSGQYRSLSDCSLENGQFRFWLEIPLALGTVGGLTSLHPIAKRSLELLGNPSATQLMSIIASTGLAQNFAALRSLVTTGIQQGHMKMHLLNILNHMKATQAEIEKALVHFDNEKVSFTKVRQFLESIRESSVTVD